MPLPKNDRQRNVENRVLKAWREYVANLESSLDILEEDINEAANMTSTCTAEWCEATEHVIDELSNSLFSISEPRWSSDEDNQRLKSLKRRVHDLYAKYKNTASSSLTA